MRTKTPPSSSQPPDARVVSGGGGTIFVALAAAAILTLPIAVQVRPLLSGVLAECTILVAVLGLVRSYVNGARVAQLFFWIFTLAWLGIAPLYQLYAGVVAWGDHEVLMIRDAVVHAQVLILLSFVAVLVGTLVRTRAAAAPRRRLDINRLAKAAWVVVLLALALLPVAAAASGGLSGLFVSREERYAALAAGGIEVETGGGAALGFVRTLPAALATVGCYIALTLLRREELPRPVLQWRVSRVVLAVTSVVALVTFANPLANSRFASVAAIACCVVGVLQPRSRTAGAVIAVLGLTGLLIAYPLAYALRYADGILDLSSFSLEDWAGPDFDGFQQWINTVLYVRANGHEGLSTILSAVLFFVPRSLWEDKAIPASITVARSRNYDFVNLSLPLGAEVFLGLGLIGLLAMMFALGRVLAVVDEAWLAHPGSLVSFLAPVVATQQIGLLRGPSGSLAPVIGTVLLALLAALWYARRTGRASGETHGRRAGPRMHTRSL